MSQCSKEKERIAQRSRISPSLSISLAHSLSRSLCVVLIILILNLLKLTNDIRRQHRCAASWRKQVVPPRLSLVNGLLPRTVRAWAGFVASLDKSHSHTHILVRLATCCNIVACSSWESTKPTTSNINSCTWVLVSSGCWAWPWHGGAHLVVTVILQLATQSNRFCSR